MTFQPGAYYVGDPGFVLPANNLRLIFGLILENKRLSGKDFVSSSDKHVPYWVAPTPGVSGTLYLNGETGYGYDWGGFGCVPWESIEFKDSYESHKFEFTEPFECSYNEDGIKIGCLHFTFEPK